MDHTLLRSETLEDNMNIDILLYSSISATRLTLDKLRSDIINYINHIYLNDQGDLRIPKYPELTDLSYQFTEFMEEFRSLIKFRSDHGLLNTDTTSTVREYRVDISKLTEDEMSQLQSIIDKSQPAEERIV